MATSLHVITCRKLNVDFQSIQEQPIDLARLDGAEFRSRLRDWDYFSAQSQDPIHISKDTLLNLRKAKRRCHRISLSIFFFFLHPGIEPTFTASTGSTLPQTICYRKDGLQAKGTLFPVCFGSARIAAGEFGQTKQSLAMFYDLDSVRLQKTPRECSP